MPKATARAGSNIAFIKYWGVADPRLNLPLNSSISMTLADAYTVTTVEWDAAGAQAHDSITLDGAEVTGKAAERLVRHLDRIRSLAGVERRARVASVNNFPMASGIASSASGFAALTVAGCRAIGLALDDAQLSALARLGSGSACRSILGGFVLWDRGDDHDTSIARQLFPPDHWDLYDVVAVVSREAKAISSEGGHQIAATSPLNRARVAYAEQALAAVREAILHRSLAQLGPILEQDALAMHAVMMTGNPSLLYWLPGTVAIMHAVRRWRSADGLPAYFTIDAGPNVHVLCEAEDAPEVQARLAALNSVQEVIVSRPGPGPLITDDHLF
ncbi:MAG TPA: diphosphomevalonate decarboxylase [Caldilineaceae bacterium]|nr:diphosphomevalonate decarboxylase [Caldilineaceae bacterium]